MVWTLSFVFLMTMSVTISSMNAYQLTDKIIALSTKITLLHMFKMVHVS